MADTDVLRIPVDTRQVDSGANALDRLDRAGTRVDSTVGNLTGEMNRLDRAGTRVDSAVGSLTEELDHLESSGNRADSAVGNLTRELDHLGSSGNRADSAVGNLTGELDQLESSGNRVDRTVGNLTGEMNRLDRAGTRVDSTVGNLTRDSNRLDRAVTRADSAVGDFNEELDQLESSGNLVSDVLVRMTRRLSAFLFGLKILQTVKQAIITTLNNFREFELALIGVGKTSNLTGKGLDDLGERLTALSLSIPVSTTELLEIATTAGQLGITGSRNIVKFTAVIAKLGRATNLSGEEAANALAQLFVITGENINQAELLASQIVSLGNKFGTTETKIATIAGEIARATSTFKLGTGIIVALAATMAQIGVEADLAGTAISSTFRVIDRAIRGQGESLKKLSKITGQTGEQLTETFGKSKITVFRQFLLGLKRIDESFGDIDSVIEDFGLTGLQILKVIPGLAIASSEFEKSVGLINDQIKDTIALKEEFSATLKAFDSNLILLDNTADTIIGTIGELLVDIFNLNDVIKFVTRSLIDLFDLPVTADVIRGQIQQLQKELKKVKEEVNDEPILGRFFSLLSKIKIGELELSIGKLTEKLKGVVGEATTSSEQLATSLEKVTDSASKLNVEYERGIKSLSSVIPKMTAFALKQIKLTEAQDKSNLSLRRQIREIGLTESELQDLTIIRAQEAVELARVNNASNAYLSSLREHVVILRKRKTVSSAFKGETEALEKNNELLSTIEGHGRTLFKSFFDSGKSTFEELTRILKETLIEALFQLTIKKWIFNIVADVTGPDRSKGSFSVVGTDKSKGSSSGLGIPDPSVLSAGLNVAGSFVPETITTTVGTTSGTGAGTGAASGEVLSATVTESLINAGIGALTAKVTKGDPVTGAAGGAIGGAIGGSIGGTFFGPPGAVVGQVIGSAIGGFLGGVLGKKSGPVQPRLSGTITRTAEGEFIPDVDEQRMSLAEIATGRDALQSQLSSFETVLEITRLNFADINDEVRVLTTDLLNADAESLTTSLFADFGRLISEGVLEGVPPALATALEDATGGKEIQQAIDSWINARTALENTLHGIVDIAIDIPPAEIAVINLNKQFSNLALQAENLGTELSLVDEAYESAKGKLRSDFIDGIETEIQKLTDPNGAALSAIRKWRISSIREASALGAGTVQIETLFNLKRLQTTKEFTSDALSNLSKSIEHEKSIISQAANDVSFSISGLTKTFSTLEESLLSIQKIGRISSTAGLDAALLVLDSALDFAKSGGRLSEFAGFADALDIITDVDERLFGTSVDFRRTLGQSEALITSLIGETQSQLTIEQMSLDGINASVDRLDLILTEGKEQVNALLGIDNSIKSVAVAFAELGTTLKSSGESVSFAIATNAIEDLGSTILSSVGNLISVPSISLPSFAGGTNVIPFDTLANVHKGERIIPAADNRNLIDIMSNGSDSAKEIRDLRKDLVALNTAIVLNTNKIKRILERQDSEGIPPERIPA